MWLQTLASELLITLTNSGVWLSVGQGLLIGAVCLGVGVWVSRFVGLLPADAPAGETLGVGLASGLLVLTTWWAAIMSGGRSAFTPVALGFLVAIAVTVFLRRNATGNEPQASAGSEREDGSTTFSPDGATNPASGRRALLVAVVLGAIFVGATAFLYGSTLAQNPRDGVQPLEFMDEAYYSILGRDLAETGNETTYSPAGFGPIDGLPRQTWYHWGEVWLAAAAISIFGTTPLDARHLIVLPLLLLAAAALTGTLVRRITGAESRNAYAFGFLASLFLAPVPVIQAGHFSSWAVGMIFGITMYGLAAVGVLLAMYGLVVLGKRPASLGLAFFAGTAAATVLPAHVVIAVLAMLGIGSVWVVLIGKSVWSTRRLPSVTSIWRETFMGAGVLLVITLVWGWLTGHSVASAAPSPGVTAFNPAWRGAIVSVIVGAGALLAIGIAWVAARKEDGLEAQLYLGTGVLIAAGAVLWGARLGDFNTFHLFYGGIVVFATPAAATAIWSIWLRLRGTTYRRLALGLLVIGIVQVEAGVVLGISRLQEFGPGALEPATTEILKSIETLPANAKLAYACQPIEEQAFWVARLLSIQAHTARTVVPMCFQAEFFANLLGVPLSADVESPQFVGAPQRTLYPHADSRPSVAEVSSFLKAHGVGYIYADSMHPNSLVPDATPIATSRDMQVLKIP